MDNETPRFILAGQLTRDFVILPSHDLLIDVPGGNALYASIGVCIWEPDPPPGMIARIGEDYPQNWLEFFNQSGIDIRGVKILPQAVDLRSFVSFSGWERLSDHDPVTHFSRLGLRFPKRLLGYQSRDSILNSRTQLSQISIRQADIPGAYLDATVAHLCPVDYLSHSLLPAIFRQAGFTTITLDPAAGYMNPTFWENIPSILTGLTAFLPSEEDLRKLFHGRSVDPWEMAEILASFGCEFIVIKCGARGQLLYDSTTKIRWSIAPYPARVVNPIGAGDAFCGGFIAGYRRTYDPLEAVLHGNIAASLVIEGNDPMYALDSLPGLAEARLNSVRELVRKV